MHFFMTELGWTEGEFVVFLNLCWMVVDLYLTILFTSRVAYYQHGGHLPLFLRIGCWLLFYFTNGLFVPIAIFLWVFLGVRLFPVFTPRNSLA